MQRAIGDLGNVRFFHVLAANARKYFAVNLHLAVGAIVGRGVDASHRSDNDEEKNSKRTDENRCFGFHGHLFWIFFRKELLPANLVHYISRCQPEHLGCSI